MLKNKNVLSLLDSPARVQRLQLDVRHLGRVRGIWLLVFYRPQVPLGPPWFDFVPSKLDEWHKLYNIGYCKVP